MKRSQSNWTITMAAAFVAMTGVPGWAHDATWVLGGSGTASVDGLQSPGEWDGALSTTFDVTLPANDGGGTVEATVFAMNDARSLYVAFRIERGGFGLATNPALFFDVDHDLIREPGDDGFGMSVGEFQVPVLFDTYAIDAAGNTGDDVADGGSVDGSTAATTDGISTFIEISHPLNSRDNDHDFSLSPRARTIGFGGLMNLFSLDAACSPPEIGSPCQAFTDFAGSFINPTGDLVLFSPSGGACQTAAVAARRAFIDSCIAMGGSRPSCTMAANEIFQSDISSCTTP